MQRSSIWLLAGLFPLAACEEYRHQNPDEPAAAGSMGDPGLGGSPGASTGGASSGAGVPGNAGTGVASGGLPASVVCDEPGQQEPELVSTMLTATDEDFVNPERGFHDDLWLPTS